MDKILQYISLTVIFCCTLTLHAQGNRSITVQVKVLDSFSREFLENARIELFEMDSTTTIRAGKWSGLKIVTNSNGIRREKKYYEAEMPLRNTFLAKIQAKNYDCKWVMINLPKRSKDNAVLNDILLDRSESFYEHTFGEATVTASRIAMVVKGDTVEYDARAFRLSNGSMLDDLFKRLNGVTITEDGAIYLNGKYVQKLLLNGQKFFDGNPMVAMRNLPAYTIDRIKFYYEGKKNEYLQDEKNLSGLNDKKPLIVDVRLKREYALGWLGNAELGGGSQITKEWGSRYMARFFGMRYTTNSNLGVYGSINNLSDNQSPGRKGEWKRMDVKNGERTSRTGGIHFNLTGKETNIEVNSSLEGRKENILATNQETEEKHIGNDTFVSTAINSDNRSKDPGKSKECELKWKANISMPFPKWYMEFSPYLNYTYMHGKCDYSYDYSMMTDQNVMSLYKRHQLKDQNKKQLNTGGKLLATIKSPFTGKNYDLNVSFDYRHVEHKQYTYDSYKYANPERNKIFNWDESYPDRFYQYGAYLHRNLINRPRRRESTILEMDLGYAQEYHSTDKYRFDVEEMDSMANQTSLLPSFWRHLGPSLNTDRSYRTASFEREFWGNIEFKRERFRKWSFYASAYLSFQNRNYIRYMGELIETIHRDDLHFHINSDFKIIPWKCSISYTASSENPPTWKLTNIIDFTDPYKYYAGNEKLKNSVTHGVSLLRDIFDSNKQRTSLISLYWHITNNAIGYERIYTPSVNQTTYRARNIRGNWKAGADIHWESPLDRMKNLVFKTKSQFTWKHSVDYSQVDQEEMTRSVVDNMQATENLSLTYSTLKGYRIGLKGDFTYYWQKARTRDYRNHAIDYDYGITLSIPFNSHLDFETDMLAYTRAGYSDKSFNSTDWVWNASLSYAWGKKKQWLVRAMGFDILHQLSSVKRVINEQGFTETRYNTVPSYALLTLVYRFNKAPKGKK